MPPSLGGSASAPVLPSERPPSVGAALTGAASSCELGAWSLTGVPEQAGGVDGELLPPPKPPQDRSYADSAAATGSGDQGDGCAAGAVPRTFALQAPLMGGREELPGKSWFAMSGKSGFLLSQRQGAPTLGCGAPSRVRQSVDVVRREMEVQGALQRRRRGQHLQQLDLIRE